MSPCHEIEQTQQIQQINEQHDIERLRHGEAPR
jgi:hypothetical protein